MEFPNNKDEYNRGMYPAQHQQPFNFGPMTLRTQSSVSTRYRSSSSSPVPYAQTNSNPGSSDYRYPPSFQQQAPILSSTLPLSYYDPSTSANYPTQHHPIESHSPHRNQRQQYSPNSLSSVDLHSDNGRSSDTDDNVYALGNEDAAVNLKRKAQNRAAQQAFRERGKRHVEELEEKLKRLQETQDKVSEENGQLRKNLERMTTENIILKAKEETRNPKPPETLLTSVPPNIDPAAFRSDLMQDRIVVDSDGQRMLGTGAAWDFIALHPLFKKGLVDMDSVSKHLRDCIVHEAKGPVVAEKDIIIALQKSLNGVSDDLF